MVQQKNHLWIYNEQERKLYCSYAGCYEFWDVNDPSELCRTKRKVNGHFVKKHIGVGVRVGFLKERGELAIASRMGGREGAAGSAPARSGAISLQTAGGWGSMGTRRTSFYDHDSASCARLSSLLRPPQSRPNTPDKQATALSDTANVLQANLLRPPQSRPNTPVMQATALSDTANVLQANDIMRIPYSSSFVQAASQTSRTLMGEVMRFVPEGSQTSRTLMGEVMRFVPEGQQRGPPHVLPQQLRNTTINNNSTYSSNNSSTDSSSSHNSSSASGPWPDSSQQRTPLLGDGARSGDFVRFAAFLLLDSSD